MKIRTFAMVFTFQAAIVSIGCLTPSEKALSSPYSGEQSVYSKREYRKGDRVAVIGAGVTGLGIARSLLDNGVDPTLITVIEKGAEPGGKVSSVTVDGRPYEIGAAVIVPGRYEKIEQLAAKYGLTTRRLDRGGQFNVATGEVSGEQDRWTKLKTFWELTRYSLLYKSKLSSVTKEKGFSDIPPQLTKPWPEFIKENNFELLDKSLASVIGGSGYLRNTNPPPAAYIARMLRPSALKGLITNGIRAFDTGGYQALWKAESNDLASRGVRFLFKANVTRIERGVNTTSVQIEGTPTAMSYEHVFFTGNLPTLPGILAGVTEAERNLYSRVQTYDYRLYLVRIDGLPNRNTSGASGIAPAMYGGTPERPVLMVKPYADTNVYLVYAYGSPNSTDEKIIRNMQEDFERFGGRITEVLSVNHWQYFPHVASDLGEFYQSVMANQGKGGVWLAGEALSVALTIEVYEHGIEFAKLFLKNEL